MAREAKQYKVEVVKEGGLGTLLVGASKLPINKIEEVLNQHGREGWGLDFMVIEQHRFLLFWTREAAILTLSRSLA
jgi:hypothetical protein